MGEGPARIPRPESELDLLPAIVDLDDDPVDFIRQLVATCLQIVVVCDGLLNPRAACHVTFDFEAQFSQPRHRLPVSCGQSSALDGKHLVEKHVQGP